MAYTECSIMWSRIRFLLALISDVWRHLWIVWPTQIEAAKTFKPHHNMYMLNIKQIQTNTLSAWVFTYVRVCIFYVCVCICIYIFMYTVSCVAEVGTNIKDLWIHTLSLYISWHGLSLNKDFLIIFLKPSFLNQQILFSPLKLPKPWALSKQDGWHFLGTEQRQRQRSPWEGRRTYIACGFSVQLVSDVSALFRSGSAAKARLSQLVVLTALAGKYVIH